MTWEIDYRRSVAESVAYDVERKKHLRGFSVAEEKAEALLSVLESIAFNAKWFGEQCALRAESEAYQQEQLRTCPEDFSEERAEEVRRLTPALYDDYAKELTAGYNKLCEAVRAVEEISRALGRAKDDAEAETENILKKIDNAIDLMEAYLRTEF